MSYTFFTCTVCGAAAGTCDCWTMCVFCGWHNRTGEGCRNPVHRAPPRDVDCPHCGATAGQACVIGGRYPLAWSHKRRITASRNGAVGR